MYEFKMSRCQLYRNLALKLRVEYDSQFFTLDWFYHCILRHPFRLFLPALLLTISSAKQHPSWRNWRWFLTLNSHANNTTVSKTKRSETNMQRKINDFKWDKLQYRINFTSREKEQRWNLHLQSKKFHCPNNALMRLSEETVWMQRKCS